MSNNKLSLDETIKQIDKRRRNLTVEQVKEHLDNIEHCAHVYSVTNNASHLNSLTYSKQTILNAFKELKGERL